MFGVDHYHLCNQWLIISCYMLLVTAYQCHLCLTDKDIFKGEPVEISLLCLILWACPFSVNYISHYYSCFELFLCLSTLLLFLLLLMIDDYDDDNNTGRINS